MANLQVALQELIDTLPISLPEEEEALPEALNGLYIALWVQNGVSNGREYILEISHDTVTRYIPCKYLDVNKWISVTQMSSKMKAILQDLNNWQIIGDYH